MKKIVLLIAILVTSSAVIAVDVRDVRAKSLSSSGCTMNENVTININFNGQIDKAAKVKALLDGRLDEVKAMAKAVGIEDIQINSQNFNINYYSNNNNYGDNYQYSGNSSIKVKPYDKALILLDKLKEKKYQSSMSVNRYQQGNCR